MKTLTRLVLGAALLGLGMGTAQADMMHGAQLKPTLKRDPQPGPSLVAATANLFYTPIRLGVTTVGAVLGGATGFLLAGDENGAQDVWGLIEGQSMLTQDIVQGKEDVRFGRYEYNLLLITPQD